jgi:hypothetical protein
MNTTVKNILAVIAGLILGSAVNMGLIMISGYIIPPPGGADVTTMEGLKESIHLFEAKHFIFPFLAHALGTFFGAFIASLVAANHKMKMALIIGVFFLIGGITNIIMIPSPAWFSILDLVGAYMPMAWLGFKLNNVLKKDN